MKIAFFVSTFPQLSETFVVSQITGLIDRGHDVTIYADLVGDASSIHAGAADYRLLERTVCRRSVIAPTGWQRLPGRLRLAARGLRRHPRLVLRSLNVLAYGKRAITLDVLDLAMASAAGLDHDVVHCHFAPNGDDAAILRGLGLLRGRLVVTFHGYDIRRGVAASRPIYARLARVCDAVHSVSAYNRRNLEAFGFDPSVIVHHPMGVDLRRFHAPDRTRRPDPEGPVTLLTVARLVSEKGHEHAIRALARVRARCPGRPWRYRLIGAGDREGALRDLAQREGLADAVEFLGPRDQAEVAAALTEADLFLLPSEAEALPVSVMEAMACGLPVIATDVGSVAELVEDGVTGRLVPPRDPEALADALVDLLDAADSWPETGRRGRERVAREYDVSVLNDRLIEHYRSLLAGP